MHVVTRLFLAVAAWLIHWTLVIPSMGADTCDSDCTRAHDYAWVAWSLLAWGTAAIAAVVAVRFASRARRGRTRRGESL